MQASIATPNAWRWRPLPPEHTKLPFNQRFDRKAAAKILRGYIPRQPEDKWFVFAYKGGLRFHRSRTGSCIFFVTLESREDGIWLGDVAVNRNPAQYRNQDDAYDLALLGYVIDVVLLGQWRPVPMPDSMAHQHRAKHEALVIGEAQKPSIIDLTMIDKGTVE